jgi:hypothetical protein
MDDKLRLGGIASLESSTPSNRANLQKKSNHKVKENTPSISPSMCFSFSTVIDGPIVNGLLLIVEAFDVFFDHFFLLLFL